MSYTCKVCKFCTASISAFIWHVKIHINLANTRFKCGHVECPAAFMTVGALQKHMYRFHKHTVKPVPQTHIESNALACKTEVCSFVSGHISILCERLQLHIKDGKKVSCPYDGRSKYFHVRSSFSSRISCKYNIRSPCTSRTAQLAH